MAFLRVVEVFPPVFPFSKAKDERLLLDESIDLFLQELRKVSNLADLFLVADLKDPSLLKLSTVEAAAMIQKVIQVPAAPVLVVRDSNRPNFLTSIVTGVSLGLRGLMPVWGDDYVGAGATNVRDFRSLADAIREASSIKERAGSRVRLLAPLDLRTLSSPRGRRAAKGRLRSGADLLLSQPPTTDPESFDVHTELVRRSRLEGRVLLNVFPFRGAADVRRCEKTFGWELSRALHVKAARGAEELVAAEREVVRKLKEEGFPGVYVSTRGDPSVAGRLLA